MNLLTAVPTVVAVSSTVENPAILPAHAVDGKLDTAWNSVTGELAGAWIAARIPADAHVDAIKLTVGFTKIEPKYGDLFTMNPRITRDNVLVSEKTLDPALRTLQDLAIGGPGGDYRVEVLEYVLGTRKDWREINISEFEVWGKPGRATPGSATKLVPVVHVGGFDHDDLTRAQCVAALFGNPKGIKVARFETDDFTDDLSICRVDQSLTHATEGGITSDKGSVTIGIVKRAARPTLVAKLPAFATSSSTGGEPTGVAPASTSIAVLDVRCQVHHERYPGNGPDDITSDTERVDHYTWDGKIYSRP